VRPSGRQFFILFSALEEMRVGQTQSSSNFICSFAALRATEMNAANGIAKSEPKLSFSRNENQLCEVVLIGDFGYANLSEPRSAYRVQKYGAR